MIQLDASSWGLSPELFGFTLAMSTISQQPICIGLDSTQKKAPLLQELFQAFNALSENLVSFNESGIGISGQSLQARTVQLDFGFSKHIVPPLCALLLAVVFSREKLRLKFRGCTDAAGAVSWDFIEKLIFPLYLPSTELEIRHLMRAFAPSSDGRLDLTFRSKGHFELPAAFHFE